MSRPLIATLVLALAAVAVPALAETPGSYDVYDLKTFNSVAGDGTEIPLRTAAVFSKTLDFDSSTYDTNPADRTGGPNGGDMTMCLKPNSKVVGVRTAWVRFRPGVSGTLTGVEVAANYNTLLRVWKGPYAPIGQVSRKSLTDVWCEDRRATPNGDVLEIQPALTKDEVAFIEVLAVCAEGAKDASYAQLCPNGDAGAAGGANVLKITFKPDDADGDGIPDSCEGNSLCDEPKPPTPTPTPTATSTPTPTAVADGQIKPRVVTSAGRTGIRAVTVAAERGATIRLRCIRLRCKARRLSGRGVDRFITVKGLHFRRIRVGQGFEVTIAKSGRLSRRIRATLGRTRIVQRTTCLHGAKVVRCP